MMGDVNALRCIRIPTKRGRCGCAQYAFFFVTTENWRDDVN